tara:strand:- start:21 stop:200 length:180 start_codon:yes stop_codon:yes gene_type:complete
MKKFVKFAKNLLPGGKNGRKTGSRFFIAVSVVEEVKIRSKMTLPICRSIGNLFLAARCP